MPLEALRWAITPPGLHYLLVHYDVPLVDPATWRLEIGGAVERPLRLGLEELRTRPAVEIAATMECAGNGRALLDPRPLSQPWLMEAVGTARWRGVPLAALLEEAAPTAEAVDVLFAGLDRGVEADVEQRYERSLLARRGAGGGRRRRVRDERCADSAPARVPRAPRGPRLVRDDEREMAQRDRGADRALRGVPGRHRLPFPAVRGRGGASRHPDAAAVAHGPARRAGLLLALADRGRGEGAARGACVVGARADRPGRGQRRRRLDVGGRGNHARARRAMGLVRLGVRVGRVVRRARALLPRHGRDGRRRSRSSRSGTSAATRTTPSSACRCSCADAARPPVGALHRASAGQRKLATRIER